VSPSDFCGALDAFWDYPSADVLFLFSHDESELSAQGYNRHFRENVGKMFDKTIPCVPIRDFRNSLQLALSHLAFLSMLLRD
jgi:hypothetical protein